jgi:carboxyl-terminal processing protease
MVVGISGYFLDREVTLGTLHTRTGELRYTSNPRRVTRSGARTEPYTGRLALVVDELSASTSEVFAGALQQLGRARVVGSNTAGQALPSVLMRLPNGDGLMYAIADLTAPNGHRLEGAGVTPDETVPVTRADLLAGRDGPLQAAVRWVGGHGASDGGAGSR